jgi:hypothetical protein
MSNLEITNITNNTVALGDNEFSDELLTFAAAGTVLAGTILARDSVSLKLVPFVKGGTTTGNGDPKAITTYDVVATAASDVAVRALVSGDVRLDKLIIDADGDGSNIDAEVLDALRDYDIVAIDVTEENIVDNQ